jgi:MtN3 and saliva related transmembrane protein
MELIATLATVMGIITGSSFFIQTIKIIKRKSSKDIALLTYSILGIGSIIWLIYGITITDLPLIISYTIGTLSTFSVIVVYFIYK